MVNFSTSWGIKSIMGKLNEELRAKTNKEYRNFSDCHKALGSCKTSELDVLKDTREKTFKKYDFFRKLKNAVVESEKKR